jgi:thioredoxin 1
MRAIGRDADLEEALSAPLVVLYKHSPLCGLSDMAARQVELFLRSHPDVPVYRVDVVRARKLAREIESRLGVRHESPQALVLRAGEVSWHGSHRAITAASLAHAVGSEGTAAPA